MMGRTTYISFFPFFFFFFNASCFIFSFGIWAVCYAFNFGYILHEAYRFCVCVCVWGGEEYMTRAIFLSAHYRYHSSINAVAKVIPNHIAFFAFLSRPTFAAGPLFLVDHFIHSWFVKKHVDFNPAAKHQNKHKFEG